MTDHKQHQIDIRYNAAWWYAHGRLDALGANYVGDPDRFAAMCARELRDCLEGRTFYVQSVQDTWPRHIEEELS